MVILSNKFLGVLDGHRNCRLQELGEPHPLDTCRERDKSGTLHSKRVTSWQSWEAVIYAVLTASSRVSPPAEYTWFLSA
eukprot:51276-Eustigmatos_ZCMA.PRE.1